MGEAGVCVVAYLQSAMSFCLFLNPHLLFHKRVSTFDTRSASWGRVTYKMLTAAEDRLEDSCSTHLLCHGSSLLDVPVITGCLLTAIPSQWRRAAVRRAAIAQLCNRSCYKLHITFTALGIECSVPQEGASVAPNRIDSSTSF